MITRIIRLLDRILFPRACIKCRKPDESLCLSCMQSLPLNNFYRNSYTFSVFSYEDPTVRRVIHRIKFFNDKTLFESISRVMAEELTNIMTDRLYQDVKNIRLVPIPITNKKLKKRGYNQCSIIAGNISKNLGIKVLDNLLYKSKETRPQSSIKKRSERLTNPLESFQIKSTCEEYDKLLIIIDDVVTTGATLNEAVKVLKKSGFRNILCLTFASQPI